MKINGTQYHTIWQKEGDPYTIKIIDQRLLPHEFRIENLTTVQDVFIAIRDMHVRGAPLIGVAAAYGMYFASREARPASFLEDMKRSALLLNSARPTAVDLAWAVSRQMTMIESTGEYDPAIFLELAEKIKLESIIACRQIGEFGFSLIKKIFQKKQLPVNILTHCNAGWLACVDHGTATAPIYAAHDAGIPVHVWVNETRPRNQGARLTAFELLEHGVRNTVIADNTAGHLMQKKVVDMVIVGTDRTTRTGDVCNKIGTYPLALAAIDNDIPFYAAVPTSSIDLTLKSGLEEIPIEARSSDEVRYIQGLLDEKLVRVLLTPRESTAVNYAFDITPARLVTGLITERGICNADEKSITEIFC